MPIYEYRCRSCDETFEALRPVGDTGRRLSCPSCGARAPQKLLSIFATGGGCGTSSTGFG